MSTTAESIFAIGGCRERTTGRGNAVAGARGVAGAVRASRRRRSARRVGGDRGRGQRPRCATAGAHARDREDRERGATKAGAAAPMSVGWAASSEDPTGGRMTTDRRRRPTGSLGGGGGIVRGVVLHLVGHHRGSEVFSLVTLRSMGPEAQCGLSHVCDIAETHDGGRVAHKGPDVSSSTSASTPARGTGAKT